MSRRWAPGITTTQRLTVTLEEREFVFDTDLNRFYVGDGSTVGGLRVANYSELADADTAMDARVDALEALTNELGSTPISAAMTPVVQAATLAAGQIALGVRETLTANRTYYISASGSDANDGLSVGAPKLTFTTLYNTVRDTIDTKGYAVTFNVAAGAYTQSFYCEGPLFGVNGEADCVVSFASGVSISTTGAPCLDANSGALVTFTGSTTTLAASGSFAYGIRIWTDARVLFGGFTFGAAALYQIYVAEAYGRLTDNCTINGNALIGALVEVNGELDFGSYTITFSGSVTYSGDPSSSFLTVGEGAFAALHTVAFSGSFTGRKYYASDLSKPHPIDKIESIPGSLEGVWTTPFVSTPQGRLTLETGVPVSTSDQTAKTTVYYQPYEGDYAPFSLSDSNSYEMCTIGVSGLSLALDSDSGHTGYHQSGKNFDLFLYRRGSSAVFTLATGPAWTNDTTRASAISKPNGIWANTSSMTVRFGTSAGDTESLSAGEGVYVGTIRCSANGQTEDSLANRFVWNAYNRRPRPMQVFEGTDSWSYSTATNRQLNNNAANQLAFVRGLDEDAASAKMQVLVSSNVNTQGVVAGIGLDSTSSFASASMPMFETAWTLYSLFHSTYFGVPGLGYHYLAALERGGGSNTQTWYGDAGVPSLVRSGIHGEVFT